MLWGRQLSSSFRLRRHICRVAQPHSLNSFDAAQSESDPTPVLPIFSAIRSHSMVRTGLDRWRSNPGYLLVFKMQSTQRTYSSGSFLFVSLILIASIGVQFIAEACHSLYTEIKHFRTVLVDGTCVRLGNGNKRERSRMPFSLSEIGLGVGVCSTLNPIYLLSPLIF